jgi:hypothetical protein
MGLTLVLEVHSIIIYSLCTYIQYNNLSMYKFRPLFLWHVSMLYTFNCMPIAYDKISSSGWGQRESPLCLYCEMPNVSKTNCDGPMKVDPFHNQKQNFGCTVN